MSRYLYSERLYGESLYSGLGASATWQNSYAFTYIKGASVYVTITPTCSTLDCTGINFYLGETVPALQKISPGVKTPVLFTDSSSGSVNMIVRCNIYSNLYGVSPRLERLQITITQETSLYTVAETVLSDALDDASIDYYIDPFLQTIRLPYSWFNPVTHRKAISRIAEACGGACYQSRDGTVRLESILYENGSSVPVDIINDDRIIDSSTPVSDVKNRVQIRTQPRTKLASQQVYELAGDKTINNGETKSYKIYFNDYDAVMNATPVLSSSPSGATIASQTWYTWGGNISILGSADGQVLTLTVNGEPLVIRGSRVVERDNSESIRQNGLRVLSVEDNQLIQDAEIADDIAEAVVSVTSLPRRDIELSWRGDPTLELGDLVSVGSDRGTVVENRLLFNGALSAETKVRRASNG